MNRILFVSKAYFSHWPRFCQLSSRICNLSSTQKSYKNEK